MSGYIVSFFAFCERDAAADEMSAHTPCYEKGKALRMARNAAPRWARRVVVYSEKDGKNIFSSFC